MHCRACHVSALSRVADSPLLTFRCFSSSGRALCICSGVFEVMTTSGSSLLAYGCPCFDAGDIPEF